MDVDDETYHALGSSSPDASMMEVDEGSEVDPPAVGFPLLEEEWRSGIAERFLRIVSSALHLSALLESWQRLHHCQTLERDGVSPALALNQIANRTIAKNAFEFALAFAKARVPTTWSLAYTRRNARQLALQFVYIAVPVQHFANVLFSTMTVSLCRSTYSVVLSSLTSLDVRTCAVASSFNYCYYGPSRICPPGLSLVHLPVFALLVRLQYGSPSLVGNPLGAAFAHSLIEYNMLW
jgi:hypothetical protein